MIRHDHHYIPYAPAPHSEIDEMSSLNVGSKTEIGLGSYVSWKLPTESGSAPDRVEHAESS